MFKIGAFAKLSGMTIKTLRHYDELGLLKPAHVEKDSGYRYYTADQLLTIRRIEGFKEQGLTLEMMRPLLTGAVSPSEAVSTLLKKREELESQIRMAQQQLEEVDERLVRVVRHAATAEDGKISLRSVEPVLVASIRENTPKGKLCLLLDELKRYVRSHGEDPEREMTIVWHRKADCDEEPSDIEVAMPISKEIPDSRSVSIYQMPGVKAAVIYTHRCDPYKNNCKAAEVLRSWAANEGYRPLETVPVREVYLTSDKDIYGQLRMAETIMPIERIRKKASGST
ncbi:MerR family transcriptional regulator [Paenibacillus soyae]|uniref:MerR family transcriptional regulator n=1 Tax=Paenibacillus soyae TaxID=2969249 RepID=A0A9X2MSD7_9BACL|nr:MerR family transcriptional regulator [Paenibacillus soyae]MCR2806021.1 MerR family transcriptional regulator [Paenibacillus soyae]